jgi:hypothetical protein
MQNSVLKNLLTFSIVFIPLVGMAQDYSLTKADSLFTQKRYTQSLDVYRTLFDNGSYTPSMLLKMAYVEEGLNHVSSTVYYLNLYYLATYDESVLSKLNELAEKNKLEGFATTDSDWALSLFYKNQYAIIISTGIASFLLIILVLVQRLKFNRPAWGAWAACCMFSVATLVILYDGTTTTYAIVGRTNSYLMEGPSAGASVLTILRDGHRVEITGKKDVWVKVKVGEKEGYIKEANLLALTL